MIECSVIADIVFFSETKGGRRKLPPLKDEPYTYRPILRFQNKSIGFCAGIVIEKNLKNYQFDAIIENVTIKFISGEEIKNFLVVNNTFTFDEGFASIGEGVIKKVVYNAIA